MDWKEKRVLVTGGAGFIGSHLVDRLIELGSSVTVLDKITEENSNNVRHHKGKISLIDSDIAELGKEHGAFDYVFHLAALIVPALCDKKPKEAFETNVTGTFNVLKFAVDNGIKKVVFPSTALVYGKKYLPVDENHPLELRGVYSITKKLGEDLCEIYINDYGLKIAYIRLFNVYGPRQPQNFFLPTVISQALKDKHIEIWTDKTTRDFIFVSDVVNAFLKVCESDFVGGPLNIGSGKETKVIDIVRKVAEKFNATIKVLDNAPPGIMRLQCNNDKARKLLNWEPKVEFDKGLELTIEWYKQNFS